MPNITISIPADLAARLEAVKPNIENLSGIAAVCIEQEVKIQEALQLDPASAGIQRLRKSKASHRQNAHAEGLEAGKFWALDDAEFDELERVASMNDFEDLHRIDAEPSDFAHAIARAVLGPADDPSHSDIVDKAEQLFGEAEVETAPVEFYEGFVEGAVNVYQAALGD